ncbi:complement resistance protein TraT [Maridesulfovibrio ferrireducens]|uniref:complement resistance protein TraT n=1 Tax=Maridesulfovibrio ferrireducens TaxID=246191 RepID=UPI001A27F467|nr:complement resistance protein TraT [Maridesulfovibrio ferrireducens]MBI9110824.1 glycine zipper 2TM domain-containing protein [Maridesulfovibrio ferrireducens]
MTNKTRIFSALLAIIALTMILSGCQSRQRMGMVREKGTGLMYGSYMNGNLFMDPSQFSNPTIKLSIRNTSGDPAVNLKALRNDIEKAYIEKGYKITKGKKYGIHIDINMRYSGQISTNMAIEYGLVGAAAGGYVGGKSPSSTDGAILGTAGGATVGAVLGSYSTEDTYIMVADIAIGLVDSLAKRKKYVINFGDTQIKKYNEETGFTAYRAREKSQVAVYAGGDNTHQSEIVSGVTSRFKKILEDAI